MRTPRATARPLAALLTAGLTALLAVALPVLVAAPAQAAPRVVVTNDRGGVAEADSTYRTAMTVDGSGFQSIQGGFGGIYVVFGWVDDPAGGTWRPSAGGLTGEDYRYVPDAENADNQGYVRFVAFPGGSTSGEANAVLTPDGSFRVDLTVPGPVFESVDRAGDVVQVDCRTTTCGVITIGAHGVANARNESFTRVSFGSVYDEAPAAAVGTTTQKATQKMTGKPRQRETQQTTPQAAQPSAASGTALPTPPAAASGSTSKPTAGGDPTAAPGATTPTPASAPASTSAPAPVVTTDRETAVAGRALAFTATGFAPGEQVLAILDDGVAALGPVVAGSAGEVAGLLQLPLELGVGTHELRLTGAASGSTAVENFPVRGATTPLTPAAVQDDASGWPVDRLFLLGSVLVLLLAVAGLVRRRLTRRSPAPSMAGVS